MSRLAGKVAVVTGAAGGIGRAVAEALAREGAAVGVADLREADAHRVVDVIAAAGGSGVAVKADISSRADVEQLADAVEAAFDTPSIVFCAAGITSAGGDSGFLTLTDDEWHRVIGVNLGGTFVTSQVLARRMVARRMGGSIVTVSSIGAERPMFGAPAYHTSKAAVTGFTRALAVNLAHVGIRANTIAPGFIRTPMLDRVVEDEDRLRALVDRVPAGRLGVPADLTGAAVFLASDESSYVTGQVLHVDGGALVLGWTSSQPLRDPEADD